MLKSGTCLLSAPLASRHTLPLMSIFIAICIFAMRSKIGLALSLGLRVRMLNILPWRMRVLITLMFLQMPLFQKHSAGRSQRSQQLKLIAGVLVNGQRIMRAAGGLQIMSMRTSGIGIMMVKSGVVSCLCRVLIR